MAFLSLKKLLETDQPPFVWGLDEAGRGPWAGPVVACALMFLEDVRIHGIKDSKQLNKEQREKIYKKLADKTVFGVGRAEHHEIDTFGLTKATNMAYQRAVEALLEKKKSKEPELMLIDGRDKFQLPFRYHSIIKGDAKVKIIACASIIAKVERDKIMEEYAKKFPEYGFEYHKGYGTKRHQQALKQHGTCEIHRTSYAPIVRINNSRTEEKA
ncbi:MAG: ribonuclease HII [Candidatus Gracilibacteria bacterium]